MKTKVHALIVSALLLTTFATTARPASALVCENPEMLVSSTRGRIINISGSEISREAMSNLWSIVTQDAEISTTAIGKMIGEDQNWLGSCFFPGVGLGVGSGYDADTRNVAVWVWANEVDLAKARLSILTRISLPATTTSTTSTVVAQSAADWVVGFGDANYDGSTVVQPMSDSSLLVASRHGSWQAGSTSVRSIDSSGITTWQSSFSDSSDFEATRVEMTASALLPDERALFLGYAQRSTLDTALLFVDASGVSSQLVIEDSEQSYAHTVAVCLDGSVYVGGETQGATTNSFVTRLNSSLDPEWTKHFGAPGKNDRLLALTCGEENSVTLSAWAGGSLAGDSTDDLYTLYTMKMSKSGVTTQTVELERDYGEFSPQSAVFSSDKSLYVVGESNNFYREAQCTEKAIGGSFISKYTAAGLLEWKKILPCGNLNRKAAINNDGDVVVVGTASSVRVAGQQKFGGDDFLLHKYSSGGVRISTQQFGSTADDVVSSLALDASGSVYIGGYMKGSFRGYAVAGDWDAVVIKQHAGNAAAPVASTTSTTSTTLAPTTTTTTTTLPPVTASTTVAPPETTTTVADVVATSTSVSAAAASPGEVTKSSAQKVVAGKKRCKTSVVKVRNKKTKKLVKVRKVVCK
jgi:hypothetical protein